MSLEHFKKQVLLLHSEQSALDDLSTGFNDRYTVHCATSGSEALNTLGEIQIDVIVTAQDLPGMSGLDALREAKKRSPETIGILLAGNEDDGLEALVGDKEVFQIVRGSITPDSLKSLIDNATQQARLLALAESANDTTANVDVPGAEHIVMETSENGSPIISDGTGRLPILDSKKVSAAGVGSQAVDVLVLTQDEEFLATVKESARGLHNVIYANTLAQADDAVRKTKVGVAVVDAAMVGADVETMTMKLRAVSPRLVAIVAGRRDDGEMLMDLINRGKVYRFLLKPVSPGRSRLAVEASVKHHLEAPDSAFKISDTTAPPPKAAPKPQPKPQPRLEPKSQPKPVPRPKPKAEAKPEPKIKPVPEAKEPRQQRPKPAPVAKAPEAPQEVPKAKIEPSSTIVPNRNEALSPIDDGLTMAFGGDDSSFAETMTGIVKSVGDSFSKTRKSNTETAEAPVAAGSGGSLLSNPKRLGIGAAALVAIIGVSFWMFSGSDEPIVEDDPVASTPSNTEAEPVVETEVVPPRESGLDDLIDEAQLATAAGRVFDPPGSNAIELYLSALEMTPGDPVAAAGLQQVIEQALGMAESAMLERRVADATTALQRVEFADPNNARLPFLNAQLVQTQLRDYVDNARLAIRESRFDDASVAIDGARSLGIADSTEIDAVADELSAALNDERVGEILAQANARLEEDLLIAPSNDNARFYFELALSIDTENIAARQGLTAVASKLVLRARAQIDTGNFDVADALLIDARRLDPSSSELAAATTALATARERLAQERREAQQRAAAEKAAAERAAAEKIAAERAAAEKAAADRAAAEKAAADRAAAEKLAAERAAKEKLAAEQAAAEKLAADRAAAEKAAAERAAAQKVAAERAAADKAAADKAAAELAAAEQAAAERAAAERIAAERAAAERATAALATAARAAARQPAAAPSETVQRPAQKQDAADDLVVAAAEPTSDYTPPQFAAAAPVQEQAAIPQPLPAPVSVSSLKRTKYVAPKYPRAAQRRSLSGWVDVAFTVDIDGTVSDISIRESNPGDTFVKSATTAVAGWEFEPVIQDGVAVRKRAAVRMMFAID
ncbi:MAG: TonB family protein [Gammaproteobacteria bacterium]|nr:TonB family protein [Gammaproteobacteria bacterium]